MADGYLTTKRNGNLPLYIGAILLALAAAIALGAFPVELGISKPNTNARRVVVAVAELDETLEGDADFLEYSESLYAGLGAYRSLAVYNSADNRVDHAVGQALDCYEALRESWQMELEGSWDPAVHGNPAYWRSFHSAVRLSGRESLGAQELREALRQEALSYTEEAMTIVER